MQKLIFTMAQSLPGFLLAITVHEWAHGYMAKSFGDNTAKEQGRLTLNPAAHIDMFGTIVLPLICLALGGAVFGYAKPVPVNLRNLKNIRKGMFWISFAGPLSNLVLGILSCFIYAVVATQVDQSFAYYAIILQMLGYSVFINFLLAVFNLIPFPPLDGSKMVASFLKGKALMQYEALSRYANMVFLLLFALSLMGVSTLGHILAPAQMLGQRLTVYFLYLLG
ncbi:MAG: site-2 protease family protein [Bacteriovoracaceae bacterium]|nr:site-2 protease family protein [Bacteriovoracaceae bacterium]